MGCSERVRGLSTKYSHPLLKHHSMCLFLFLECVLEFVLRDGAKVPYRMYFYLLYLRNRRPFSEGFHAGNKKKSTGVKYGDLGGVGTAVVSCFVKNSWIRSDASADAVQFCGKTTHLPFLGQNRVARTATDCCCLGKFTESQLTTLTNHSKHYLNVIILR